MFACCKKHISYFRNIYLHIIETDLYTISLASKLLKCDEFFVIFDILMNVKVDFHISHSKNAQLNIFSLLRHHYLSFIKPHAPLVLCMDLYLCIIK